MTPADVVLFPPHQCVFISAASFLDSTKNFLSLISIIHSGQKNYVPESGPLAIQGSDNRSRRSSLQKVVSQPRPPAFSRLS